MNYSNPKSLSSPPQSQINALLCTLENLIPKMKLPLHQYSNQELDELLAEVRMTLERLDANVLLQEAKGQENNNAYCPRSHHHRHHHTYQSTKYPFSNSNKTATGHKDKVWPIHDDILPKLSGTRKDCVRYIHIFEYPQLFNVGIFVFPPGSRIPLHDHPNMCVLSRILYGTVRLQSFDVHRETHDVGQLSEEACRSSHSVNAKSQPSSFPHRIVNYLRSLSSTSIVKSPDTTQKAVLTNLTTFSAPQTTILYPKLHNLHEFVALDEGAAILDVLLPPYNSDEHRDCHFYQMPLPIDETFSIGSLIELIKMTEQPDDFHCINGEFGCIGEYTDEDEDSVN